MPAKITVETFLDQDLLRQVEALCTQEDPPACQSACPVHLDARKFISLIREGKTAEAWKLYAKGIPLAPLAALACNAPCKGPCKRAGLGGSVEMGLLERFVYCEAGLPSEPPFLLPKKTQKAAIIGGGLRALAAANNLARKGYAVTVFEASSRLGGWLLSRGGPLVEKALEGEVAALLKMPVAVEYGSPVPLDTPDGPAALLGEGYGAVYAACASPLDGLADGATLLTPRPGILAGRRSGRLPGCSGKGDSAVYDIFDGVSAAITMDRLFQGVSVDAGREREGSFETRLFTGLDRVVPSGAVSPGNAGYGREEAAAEAARCLQCECNECVKKCAFMQKYKSNPRRYVRIVYNNLSIAMGNHDANGMINECALCSQCGAICPNGLNLADVFLAARRHMVKSGKMPPSAHEFALLDMRYSMSPAFFLCRSPPGFEKPEYLFFPGCQLPASEPELVRRVYADLRAALPGGVGIFLGCCGIMAHWAGEAAVFREAKEQLCSSWEHLGKPALIAACPSCASALRDLMGIETSDIFGVLAETGLGGKAGRAVPESMVLHHACGARGDRELRDHVRGLAALMGMEILEGAPDNQDPCCGYGGLAQFANAGTASALADCALGQLGGEGPLLTYCINCRDRFRSKGRDTRHLLELLYPDPEAVSAAKAWKSPTWSRRQDNRASFRRVLLKEIWGEETEAGETMELILDGELEQKIERTHILRSDIAGVIERAEAGEGKFRDPGTGHFIASRRPAHVTFWVEYGPEGGGFRVYNAYSHRMTALVT
ncbi:MAG: NAD(P)-binding protein [Spirochaetaceae bacterium]|jgi:Fe-S oxidoreductase|nr:NAD(P)-binding protein [Spirochaetaceae bacterium]